MKNDYKDLIDSAVKFLEKMKINTPLVCDHICYRVTTNEAYTNLKTRLTKEHHFVHEANVRGRFISIFKFIEPINHNGLTIESLELPAPKLNNSYEEGFEHLEFVIEDLSKLISENPEIDFDQSGMSRNLNPELSAQINERFQIKFHPINILEVIEIEKKLNLKNIT